MLCCSKIKKKREKERKEDETEAKPGSRSYSEL